MSRPGAILGWLALGFAVASTICLCAMWLFKFGFVSWPVAHFLIERATQPLALLAVACGVVSAGIAGFQRRRGAFVLALGAAAFAILMYVSASMQIAADHKFPPIHDVSTTWTDPPMPSTALAKARGTSALPVEVGPILATDAPLYAGKPVAEVNARTCPAAVPITLTTTPDKAYAQALKAVRDRDLRIVTDDPAHGTIEATSTNFWNMHEDLMVRVRAEGAGARVDLRSVSREASNDRGHNCRRLDQVRAALTGR